jgi:cell division protein FtsB
VERLNAEKVEKLKVLDKTIQKLEGDMEDLRQRHGKLSLKKSAKEAGCPMDALFGGGGASSSAGKRKTRSPERLGTSHRSQRDVDRAKMESLKSENARLKAEVAARTGGASSSAPPKSVPLSVGEESEEGEEEEGGEEEKERAEKDDDYVDGSASKMPVSKKTRTETRTE